MTIFETLKANLERRGFAVTCFETAEEAAAYLEEKLAGKTVGYGGSTTLTEMGLPARLDACSKVISHWRGNPLTEAAVTQAYLSSVNAIAETGEIINIDGTGNRVASTIFGHEMLYLIVGRNKITPDYDAALWRARNIAAPKNAQRLNRKTPCAVKADRCYDCSSPERICKALSVLWQKPNGIAYAEVVLINQDLGY